MASSHGEQMKDAGDSCYTPTQLSECFKKLGISEDQTKMLLAAYPNEQSQSINYNAFVSWLNNGQSSKSPDNQWAADGVAAKDRRTRVFDAIINGICASDDDISTEREVWRTIGQMTSKASLPDMLQKKGVLNQLVDVLWAEGARFKAEEEAANVKADSSDNLNQVVYVTDVEGQYDYWMNLVNNSKAFYRTKDGGLELKENTTFVYGGDLFDRGPGDLRLAEELLGLKDRYKERVILIMGNRDINKMRLTSELSDEAIEEGPDKAFFPFWSAQVPDLKTYTAEKGLVHNRVTTLRWMLDKTFGAPKCFEFRREELATLSGKSTHQVSDGDVVKSFLDACAPGGIYARYLQNAQLAYLHGDTLFVHGAAEENALGLVPTSKLQHKQNTKSEVDDACTVITFSAEDAPERRQKFKQWVDELNAFASERVDAWMKEPYWKPGQHTGDRTRECDALLAYQMAPCMGGRTVTVTSYVHGLNMPGKDIVGKGVVDPMAAAVTLQKCGVRRVIVGHSPSGQAAAYVRSDEAGDSEGFEVLSADVNYADLGGHNDRGRAWLEVIVSGSADVNSKDFNYAHFTSFLRLHGVLANGERFDNTLSSLPLSIPPNENGVQPNEKRASTLQHCRKVDAMIGRRLVGNPNFGPWWVRSHLGDGLHLVSRKKDRFTAEWHVSRVKVIQFHYKDGTRGGVLPVMDGAFTETLDFQSSPFQSPALLEYSATLVPLIARICTSIGNADDLSSVILACANLKSAAMKSLSEQSLTASCATTMTRQVGSLLPELAAGVLDCGEDLRKAGFLITCNKMMEAGIKSITESSSAKKLRSTRSGFVQTLPELIGPEPGKNKWQDEWEALNLEAYASSIPVRPSQADLDSQRPKLQSLETKLTKYQNVVSWKVGKGWTQDDAEAHCALSGFPSATIGKFLAARDKAFAASTYALYKSLVNGANLQEGFPKRVYIHMTGEGGDGLAAVARDPRFKTIETADENGFKGFTACSEIRLYDDPKFFAADNIMKIAKFDNGQPVYEQYKGDMLCVVSRESDDNGWHSVIQTEENDDQKSYSTPPNTLFRLLAIREAGEWNATREVYPACRCIDVGITYLASTTTDRSTAAGKLSGDLRTLSFADRSTYGRGMSEITTDLILTMEQEWLRDDDWISRDSVQYYASAEWEYVTGAAGRKGRWHMETFAGTRDQGENAGKTPADFRDAANKRLQDAGHHDQAWQLNLEDVLAVRLYSGPGFQPINAWLRNIGKLDLALRLRLAKNPGLTYAATVTNLISAIRKLSRLSTNRVVYRGINGHLPRSFFLPDETGMVCATDLAFMSTSVAQATPLEYMGHGKNILWEIDASKEDAAGYHNGADISMLSQFGIEQEVLFPPLTMLKVKEKPGRERPRPSTGASPTSRPPPQASLMLRDMSAINKTPSDQAKDGVDEYESMLQKEWDVADCERMTKHQKPVQYKQISVRPTFV